jgi:WD40 repeat protein
MNTRIIFFATGASDGGIHVYDLHSMASSVAHGSTDPHGSADPSPLRSLTGHAAGVLTMDLSTTASSSGAGGGLTLASGSEDGTVRLWDCRSRGEEVWGFTHVQWERVSQTDGLQS